MAFSRVVLSGFLLILFSHQGMSQHFFFRNHILPSLYKSGKIELIHQDKQRMIWFGTTEGLVSYDGIDFNLFTKNDTTSEHVSAIYDDTSGGIWIGYEDGSIYKMVDYTLKPWVIEEGWPVVPIQEFLEDNTGRIWISTYGEGLYYFDNKRLNNFDEEDGLLSNDIYAIELDEQGRVWVGSDGGISICSILNGAKTVRNITREDGLPDEIVHSLLKDDTGKMWIGMYDKGFCYFNPDYQRIEFPFQEWNKGIVNDIELFSGLELWVGTQDNGLWRYNLQTNQLFPITENTGAIGSKIYDLLKDVEGNIWITSNSGQICSSNRQLSFYESELKNIQSVLVDDANQVWIGTENGLFLQQYNKKGELEIVSKLQHLQLNVLSLYQDKSGILWIGTFGAGIYGYDPVSGKYLNLKESDGLSNNNVLSIDGREKTIWMATLGGVSSLEINEDILTHGRPLFTNYDHESGIGTNFIYKVLIDCKKRVWFATDGKGVSVLEAGKIHNYAHATGLNGTDSLELKSVYSIMEDGIGQIWVSTPKDGLFVFKDGQFKAFPVRNLNITSLIPDMEGRVLMIHPGGIDCLDPKTGETTYFGEEVGISKFDPNLNAVCKDNFGNILVAAQDKLIKLTHLKEKTAYQPLTRIMQIYVSNELVKKDRKPVFKSHHNFFTFHFKGFWFTNPESIKYKYRLVGYDMNWIPTRDPMAVYSQLPPGKYEFQVISNDSENLLDSYAFTILSPLWMRWWFIVGTVSIAFSILMWYIKTREKRLKRVSLLEKEKAESELSAIKAQINPHFLFNSFNALIEVIEDNPKMAVEYVEKLSDFYRSILHYKDNQLIPLEEEIKLILDFEFLLKKRFGEHFKLKLELGNRNMAYIPPLTLQLLVENAVKHNVISRSKPLEVNILRENDQFITVSNKIQEKNNLDPSTKFGLEGLRKRYGLLGNYNIKVSRSDDFFKVSVPILEKEIL